MLKEIAFCLVSSDHGTMIVNRLDYNDGNEGLYGVGNQILTAGQYDIEEVGFLKSLLDDRRKSNGDGVVAIDCGANIGVHSVEWARLMRDWGRVIAIEAQERIFYALAGNLTLQNCFNARAIWAAVDRECGEMMVAEPDYSQPGSFGSLELKYRQLATEYIGQCIDYEEPLLKVKTLSIDSLNLPRVDLIKMDVEGMELDALMGARATIARCKPDLFVEVTKSEPIDGFLREMNYEVVKKMGMNVLASHA